MYRYREVTPVDNRRENIFITDTHPHPYTSQPTLPSNHRWTLPDIRIALMLTRLQPCISPAYLGTNPTARNSPCKSDTPPSPRSSPYIPPPWRSRTHSRGWPCLRCRGRLARRGCRSQSVRFTGQPAAPERPYLCVTKIFHPFKTLASGIERSLRQSLRVVRSSTKTMKSST